MDWAKKWLRKRGNGVRVAALSEIHGQPTCVGYLARRFSRILSRAGRLRSASLCNAATEPSPATADEFHAQICPRV